MKRIWLANWLALMGCVLWWGCGGDPTPLSPEEQIRRNFPTSLHATREGKRVYSKERGGFETLTQVPIERLGCLKCHPGTRPNGEQVDPATYQPDCADCHVQPGDAVADDTCLKCHSRQKQEKTLYAGMDVHFARGMKCVDCHPSEDMHGDGNRYDSWLAPGAVKASCERCHAQLASNPYHNIHKDDVHCTACHTKSVISCYNCHLKSEVAGQRKRPYGILRDFELLLRRRGSGKVYSGTMMTLSYEGKTFLALAPYRSHIIVRRARTCSDCHNNAAVQEYKNTGRITVTKWENGRLVGPQGVIPVPPDWEQALQWDFLDYTGDPAAATTDPNAWVFLKTGADGKQLIYAEPLTAEQMEKLKTAQGG